MSLEEFQGRDLELQRQISDYREDSSTHAIQIAQNEREIIRLERERTELRTAYAMECEN